MGTTKFLIENKINTDGDFSYPFQNFKVAITDTEERAFEQVKIIMNSLLEAKSSKSEWTKTNVKKAAYDWLSKNKKYKKDFDLPDYELGNSDICVTITPVKVSESLTGIIAYQKEEV